MMDLITITELDLWKACDRQPGETYSDSRLKKLLRGRSGWTPLQVANSRSVPVVDRIWVLLRPEVLGRAAVIDLVNSWADRTVRAYALHYSRKEVESWARGWLDGTDRSIKSARATTGPMAWATYGLSGLGAPGAAAWAVRAATWAVGIATHAPTNDAAYAAYAAATATANAATHAAATANAGAAEERGQLADIRKILMT